MCLSNYYVLNFFLIIISSSFKLQNLSNVFQQLWAVTKCRDISVQLFFTDELSWTSEDSSETKEELLLSHVYKYSECVHKYPLMSRNECHKKGRFDEISSKWANIYRFDHFDKFSPFYYCMHLWTLNASTDTASEQTLSTKGWSMKSGPPMLRFRTFTFFRIA